MKTKTKGKVKATHADHETRRVLNGLLNEMIQLRESLCDAKELASEWEDRCDDRDRRIKELKNDMAQEFNERKRLQGYVERVKEMEQPEERRRRDRRAPIEPFHSHNPGYDFYGRDKDNPRPWYE